MERKGGGMSEAFVKMLGLVLMIVSIFIVILGLYIPPAGSQLVVALVVGGLLMWAIGFVCYAVYRKD